MQFQFTPQAADTSAHQVMLSATIIGAVLLTALVGCSSDHPAAPSTTSPAAASSTPVPVPAPPPHPASVHVDALTIGNTGVRCFVGNTSFACVADTRKMTYGRTAMWTFIGPSTPGGGLEAGFAPGQLVAEPAVGDIAFVDTSSCNASAPSGPMTPMACRSVSLIPTVPVSVSSILVGEVSRVSATDLTIRMTDRELPPIPQPATPAKVYYRPNPGQQLNPDQPVTLREYTFTLHGNTLTIKGPYGSSDIGV